MARLIENRLGDQTYGGYSNRLNFGQKAKCVSTITCVYLLRKCEISKMLKTVQNVQIN